MRWTWSTWWNPDSRDTPVERPPHSDGHEVSSRRLGLALSAGGAKGLAHIGVLKVLEDHDIEVDAIAGSSMGSYIGALWACGYSASALEDLAAEMQDRRQLWRLADPVFPPTSGLFHGNKARRHLMQSIGDLRFEDLVRRLLIVTFDLETSERLVVREGSIAHAVHASCAMPGIIKPVRLGAHRCADGGVVDPVPVSCLHRYADVDLVVAVNAFPSLSEVDRLAHRAPSSSEGDRPSVWKRSLRLLNRKVNLLAEGNVIDTMQRSVTAAQLRIAQQSCRRASLCIQPEFDLEGLWHDYSNFRHYIDAGRAAAEAALPQLKPLLDPNNPTTNHEGSPHSNVVGERVA